LWGNPLYKWSEHENTNYEWWIQRIKSTLKLADLIRMDHFRGFSGYWEVPAGMPTAEKGRWVKVDGEKFFAKVKEELGELPFIAEDLGEISQDVVDLRDSLDLPGMRILQFAFGDDARNLFLPHNYVHNCIAYTGTHDNDTSIGWYQTANEKEKDLARKYLSTNGLDIAWRMVNCVFSSVAVFALAPLQDILQQGKEARMNFPGKSAGNWKYQFASNDLTPDLAIRIRQLNIQYNRIPAINRIPLEKPDITYESL
jgi:4-alpha-glucanotransferase